jgi:hypothetical protein
MAFIPHTEADVAEMLAAIGFPRRCGCARSPAFPMR